MDLKDLGLQRLKLNINDDIIEAIVGKEGDHKSRGLEIQILKNDVVTDTTGIELDFYAKPADGKTYMVRAKETNIKQGKYEIVYPSVILQPGKVESEIVLTKGEQVISTKKFDLLVEDTIATDDIVEKSDDRPLLAILVEAAKNEKSRIEAENKRVVAEGKRAETENKREQNESQRKSAESQRQKNEEERKSNEVQRQSNESTRQAQENKRNETENARKSSEESRKAAENTRQSNESKRIAAENERVKNEDARKANEVIRIANEKKREENRKIIESWIANPSQFNGKDLEFHWNGTRLGVRLKGDTEYQYVDLRGPKGSSGDGDMSKSVYDKNNNGVVDRAEEADKASEADTIDGKHASDFANKNHMHDSLNISRSNEMNIANNFNHTGGDIWLNFRGTKEPINKLLIGSGTGTSKQAELQARTFRNDKGEEVAYKNYLDNIKAEFNNHEKGPYHIIESGSNSNGDYLKFADGTLICYKNTVIANVKSHSRSEGGVSGNYFDYNWSYPASFSNNPVAFCTGSLYNGQQARVMATFNINNSYTTSAQVRAWAFDVFDKFNTLFLLAIGRWK